MTKELNKILDEIRYRINHTQQHIDLCIEMCQKDETLQSNYALYVVLTEFSNILGRWNCLTNNEKLKEVGIYNDISNIKDLIELAKKICPLPIDVEYAGL